MVVDVPVDAQQRQIALLFEGGAKSDSPSLWRSPWGGGGDIHQPHAREEEEEKYSTPLTTHTCACTAAGSASGLRPPHRLI